jgi:hypothetical protein
MAAWEEEADKEGGAEMAETAAMPNGADKALPVVWPLVTAGAEPTAVWAEEAVTEELEATGAKAVTAVL